MTFSEIVIAGCGNPLFADDGFGTAVAEELHRRIRSTRITVVDAGTSAPQFLFPLINPAETKKIIIIDIVDFGGRPGTLVRMDRDDLKSGCVHDAHSGGIISAIGCISREVDITIIGCQPGHVSDPVYEIGLSTPVKNAVPAAAGLVIAILGTSIHPLDCHRIRDPASDDIYPPGKCPENHQPRLPPCQSTWCQVIADETGI